MTSSFDPIEVQLLADDARLIAAIGELRWREWGHAPEPEDLDWWIDVTAREAGRDRLPVTWVAVDGRGDALGAVGLGAYDIEERGDRSPWVLGMIVRPDHRGLGIGRLLMSHLEAWAGKHGYMQVWVANEGPAIGFYQACGWELSEEVETATGARCSCSLSTFREQNTICVPSSREGIASPHAPSSTPDTLCGTRGEAIPALFMRYTVGVPP